VATKPALLTLFTHRNPALLLSGQAISNFGDGVANVAFSLLVIDTTHSAAKLGWFTAARIVPMVLFVLVGGALVDRLPRRALMLWSDIGRGVLTAGLTVLVVTRHLHFIDLLVFGGLFGTFDAVFTPAFSALVPEITPEELLPAMNGARPVAMMLLGNTLGPAIGGLLVSVSTSLAIGLDAATFALSALTLAVLRVPPAIERTATTSMTHEIKEGLLFVRRAPWMLWTLIVVTFVNGLVFFPSSVLIPYFLRVTLHDTKSTVGLAFALFGVAGAAGGLLSSNLKMPRRRVRRMWTYWTLGTASALAFAIGSNFWIVMIFPVVAGLMMPLGGTIWESMLQIEVPRELLGRVSSVDWFVSFAMSPVGIVVASALSSHIGVAHYFELAVAVCAPGVLYVLLSPHVNSVDAQR